MNSINMNKNVDLIDEYNESDYVPFVVNRCFSYYPDTILLANELNQKLGYLDKKLQYKYYLYSVRKKKRFSPWLKYKADDKLKTIQTYYNTSLRKAKEMSNMVSDDDIKNMKNYLDKGGKKK